MRRLFLSSCAYPHAAVPSRVAAALEVESGLNDPMSVFLTVGLVEALTVPAGLDAGPMALLFVEGDGVEEMGGGAALGAASGYTLLAQSGQRRCTHSHCSGRSRTQASSVALTAFISATAPSWRSLACGRGSGG